MADTSRIGHFGHAARQIVTDIISGTARDMLRDAGTVIKDDLLKRLLEHNEEVLADFLFKLDPTDRALFNIHHRRYARKGKVAENNFVDVFSGFLIWLRADGQDEDEMRDTFTQLARLGPDAFDAEYQKLYKNRFTAYFHDAWNAVRGATTTTYEWSEPHARAAAAWTMETRGVHQEWMRDATERMRQTAEARRHAATEQRGWQGRCLRWALRKTLSTHPLLLALFVLMLIAIGSFLGSL